MKLLTVEEIFASDDLKIKKVDIPEWGGFIFTKTMTSKERDAYEMTLATDEGENRTENFRARLVAATSCDSKGNLLFSNGDAEKLGQKSPKAIGRLFKVARELNAIGDDQIEKLEKNLPKTPGED
jgi:hypothetical protein